MDTISLLILLVGFAALLRIIPHILSPDGAGVDHWFWKKHIETCKQNKIFPPIIPQYLLDEHQWYPPLFPLLMMRLPLNLFENWNHLLAIAVDLLRMILLLFIAEWLTEDTSIVLLAGLIYATTPIQISYNFQLNPRGLAALFLDTLLMLLLWYFTYHEPSWIWLVVGLLAGLILLTHKMTTQLFWFICLCSAAIYKDVSFLLLIPVSICVALGLSKGFYFKVLIAHWDIIKFWQQNWRWLGSDAIRESPIYGCDTYQRPEKLHKTGFKGFFWHCFLLFGFNPAAWIACLLMFERLFIVNHVLFYSSWLIVWILIPCLLSFVTTFVPLLRCIGAGYLYLYNTSLITSLLLAMAFRYTKSPKISLFIYVTALSFNILGVILFYLKFIKDKRSRIDQAFNQIIEKLKTLPVGTVWCIPTSWHEPIAYKTQHAVVWGAHGYGFKRLKPTFPRLLQPINEIIDQYKVSYLLTMEGTLTEACMADLPKIKETIRIGGYLLYHFS